MKAAVINFSKQREKKQRKRDLMVLFLCLLLLVFVGREALLLQKQAEIKSISSAQQHSTLLQMIEVTDPEQQKLARTMAKSLNVPWYELLAALESIKQANPDVFLTSVLPDVRKNEVIIKGQVASLDLLLLYIDSLNQHPLFDRALPVNQQQLVSVNGSMEFTLKVGWNHE